MIEVETVASEAAFREFIALPGALHPRSLFVPLLESTVRSWYRGTSPHGEPVALVVARDERGTVVGRTTSHSDRRFDDRLGEPVQLFGATEFRDGEVAAALFAHLETAARKRSARALFGPASLLPNQAGGVVTSGFGERGFVDSAWNPEWVPLVFEAEGFERWGESDTWMTGVPPARAAVTPPTDDEWLAAGVRLEYGSRRRVGALVPELLQLLNASFRQLPYYTQISPAEMEAATDGLAFLLDERLLLLARDGSNLAVAFVLAVPDITQFLQRTGGRLTPLRQLQLLLTRSRYRSEAVLVIQGTAPEHQGRGILTLLSRQLQSNLAVGGYRTLRSTPVGRDNPASAAQFSRFGGRPLHGVTYYRRAVPA